MNEKLLLIEDDHAIGRIVKDTLEQEGYFVTWATTGLEGLADFQAQPFDLVLVDWMLPEMDGTLLFVKIFVGKVMCPF